MKTTTTKGIIVREDEIDISDVKAIYTGDVLLSIVDGKIKVKVYGKKQGVYMRNRYLSDDEEKEILFNNKK